MERANLYKFRVWLGQRQCLFNRQHFKNSQLVCKTRSNFPTRIQVFDFGRELEDLSLSLSQKRVSDYLISEFPSCFS